MRIIIRDELAKRAVAILFFLSCALVCFFPPYVTNATENLRNEVERIELSKSFESGRKLYLRIYEDIKTKNFDIANEPRSWPKPAEACFGSLEHPQCFYLVARVTPSISQSFAFFENIDVVSGPADDIYVIEAMQPTYANLVKSAFIYKQSKKSGFHEIGPAFFVKIDGGYKLFPASDSLPSLFVISSPKDTNDSTKTSGRIYSLDIYMLSEKYEKFVFVKKIDSIKSYMASGELAEEDVGEQVIQNEFQKVKSAVENWLSLQPEKE